MPRATRNDDNVVKKLDCSLQSYHKGHIRRVKRTLAKGDHFYAKDKKHD